MSDKRVTLEMVEDQIVAEDYHVFPATNLTVCCLTLKNGFTVTGESACVDPANFNEELGRAISRDKARDKIWPLLAFRMLDAAA